MISRFIKEHKQELLNLFSKKELEIILKHVKGVALSQADLNRLSREIRPKFSIIEKMSLIATPFFKLKKGCETEIKLKEFIDMIKLSKYKDKIKKITLFGSYLEKNNNLNSDIDLALSLPKSNEDEINKILLWVNSEKEEGIDINIYEYLPINIQKEVDNGRILYENKR